MATWASGVSLGWALFSLAIGVAIMAVIITKLWRDVREIRQEREKS